MRGRAIAGSVLLLGGMAFIVLAGYVMRHRAGPCFDIGFGSQVFARTSIGPQLPIPIVQSCTNGGGLALSMYAGYAVAFAGTLTLLRARVSWALLGCLGAAAIAAAMAVPFVTDIDPYAYASYAYDVVALNTSPYFAHHAFGHAAVGYFFESLFPDGTNPIRISPYGPFFIGIYSAIVGPLTLISVKAAIFGERGLCAAALLALAIIMALTQHGTRARQMMFMTIALNPLLLLQSVSFTHGDVFMLLLLALAFALYRSGKFAAAAAFCILATETRFIALLSILVLGSELIRRRAYRALIAAGAGAAFALLVTALLSVQAFGVFRLAGEFLYAPSGAPGTILAAMIAGNGPAALKAGLAVDACLGALAVYAAIRSRTYGIVPLGAMFALPTIEPNYVQWLGPVVGACKHGPYRMAAFAFMLAALLQTVLDMTSRADDAFLRSAVVVALWLSPAAAYAIAIAGRRRSARTLPAAEVT